MNLPNPNTPIWSDVTIPNFPQLQENVNSDVVVVGLGGSGLSAVRTLRDLGKKVVGIDAHSIASGAAGRNGGFILAGLAKFYHDTVRLLGSERSKLIYQKTLDHIQEMSRAVNGECIQIVGSLRIEDNQEGWDDCAQHMNALRMDGFEAESYDGEEGEGILIPSDGVFHPMEYCRRMVTGLQSDTVSLFENTLATKIETGKVTTPNGVITCSDVLVAVDGRLENVFPQLASEVQTHRLQMMATEPFIPRTYTRPVYMNDGYDYLRQLDDGRIAIGGCRNLFVSDERVSECCPTDQVQEAIHKCLSQFLGTEAPKVTHQWAGLVSFSNSGLPIAQEVMEKVYALGAYSGTGNVVGRYLGQELAREIVTGERGNIELFTRTPVSLQ